MRQTFVRLMARTGLATESARQAGYGCPESAAYRLMGDPRAVEAVRLERQRLLEGEVAGLAYAGLVQLITDERSTPPSVRFQACKFALEVAGHGRQEADGLPDHTKPLADMTLAELGAFIQAGEQALESFKRGAIEGEVVPQQSANRQITHRTELELADLLG
ncbi:hypothetical protein IB275_30300 [Pseudomonas sp. PDM21]|uniref:hypothetical protein n=1 Tax=Pseudomonas sp. PDM21 TaxID=2769257 RepID=UPI00178190DD|nr:hypothetical protein [Pseudomonas sp. PDM21]MBD9674907.1 hypothetical protein [Pseudomonas sp. PDM21]